MQYKKLGKTDIDVSVICLGTMTFGEQNSEQEAHQQLNYAIDHGVNIIDTAELYAVPSRKENNGLTEDYIGTWVEKYGNRDKYLIATKVAGPSANLKYIAENLGFSKERIHHAIDRSLRRLQTDYVDIYQLHWPERYTNYFGQRGYTHDQSNKWEDNIADVVDTMNGLVKDGKIRHWGLSNETPWGVMRFFQEGDAIDMPRPVTVQNPYSLLNRTFETGMAEISIREKMGLLAYSPMAFGLLSGKYHKGIDVPRDRRNKYKQMSRYDGDTSYHATGEYLKIAEKYDISLAQMALAFINSREFITSNIIGATTMEQLKENIESADIHLSKEILEEINTVHNNIPNPAP